MVIANEIVKKVWVHDIEQLKNFHSNYFLERNTGEVRVFVIHPSRNDIWEYLDFLDNEIAGLIGFNNVNYDYPLLHYIMNGLKAYKSRFDEPDFINNLLYAKSNEIIGKEYSAIPPWEQMFPICDPFKIHHFDNKNKRTSLKQIQFVIRSENVEDMPIHHSHKVKDEDVDKVLSYNGNDVITTKEFLDVTQPLIELRKAIEKQYGIPCINFNDAKIGQEIFVKEISKSTGESEKVIKAKKTPRETIDIGECILPIVNFKSNELQIFLKWLKKQIITETKGAFSELPVLSVTEILPYMNKTKKNGKIKNLNVIYNGFQFDFGLGGIHGSIKAGRYDKDEEYDIIDIDVASFYPNLAIVNGFYPEHLSRMFCAIYKKVYDDRAKAKKDQKNKLLDKALRWLAAAINSALKLALNGVYGKSNDKWSPFYDPKYTMKTTINGQLLLVMLAERIAINIPDSILLQVNTDGLTVKIKKTDRDKLYNLCKKWEELTKLELEYMDYRSMIIKDVNNYIAIKDKPEDELEPEQPKASFYDNFYTKHKTKGGAFEVVKTQNGAIAYNKNWSFIIVQKALYNYFIYDIPVKDTIYNSKDFFDFCGMMKLNRAYNGEFHKQSKNNKPVIKKLSKTTRYYISVDGGILYKRKVETNKLENKEKGYRVTIANKISKNEIPDNINYAYYINECKKITDVIEGFNNGVKQLDLGL